MQLSRQLRWALKHLRSPRHHKIGLRPEPEVYPIPFVMNDGQWTPEEHETHLHKASQAARVYRWDREARAETERQNRQFVRDMAEWMSLIRMQ